MRWILTPIFAIFKLLVFVLAIVAVFAIFELSLYIYEGGLKVADDAAEPALSHVFHFRYIPIGVRGDDRSLFRPNSISPIERWLYWGAMRKFPTLEHCISKDDEFVERFKALDWQTNWKSFRTGEQAQLCIHHIVSALGGNPDDVVAWLQKEGFKARSYDWQKVNGEPTKILISATWIPQDGQPLYPFSPWSSWFAGDLSPFVVGPIGLSIMLHMPIVHPTSTQIHFQTAF